ncbi:MAG: hypothetical protein GX803_08885 [Lentisphaerae bacterium]|nr:hypothetical protein [Lentisphaerota bacterium]
MTPTGPGSHRGILRSRAIETSNQLRRQFERAGWRMAVLAVLVWFAALGFLLKVVRPPARPPAALPSPVRWLPGAVLFDSAAPAGPAADLRVAWSPSVFALPGPVGFSRGLRSGRAELAPPDQPVGYGALGSPDPAPLAGAPSPSLVETSLGVEADIKPFWPGGRVFPARTPEPGRAVILFSDGWEARLFSGMDLTFESWTDQAWTAQIDLQFDAGGIPRSALLARPSGLSAVDQRLVRQVQTWRLLDAEASRAGRVTWRSPAASTTVTEPKTP